MRGATHLPPTPEWNAPDAAFIPLCRGILAQIRHDPQPTNLMFVVVRAVDPGDTEDYWFQIDRRVFKAATVAPLVATPPPRPSNRTMCC